MPPLSQWKLLPERLAVHLPTNTAVVADMHLGYIAARQAGGEAVPHFSELGRLGTLRDLLVQVQIHTLVLAGDAVESAQHGLSPLAEWAFQLHESNIMLHLVPGNHDVRLEPITHVAVHPEGYRLGDWLVLHDAPVDDPRPIVHGHLHPYLRKAGLEGEAPCFLHHPSRLVLPPWCKHAAGGNVLGMHDWRSADCSAILDGRVVALGPLARLRRLLPGKPKSYRIGIGLTQ